MNQEVPATLLLDAKVIEDPYPFYRQLHRYAPVWRVPGTEVLVVSSFALVTEAVSRFEDFSSNMRCFLYRDDNGLPARSHSARPVLTRWQLQIRPSTHCTGARSFPTSFQNAWLLWNRTSSNLPPVVWNAHSTSAASISWRTSPTSFPITVISRLIGLRNSDVDRLLRAAFDSTEMVGVTLSRQRLFELMTRSNDLGAWIAEQMAIAAAEPGEDILTSIGRGVESGALSAPAGIVILQILLAAGGESTTSLIGSAVRLMAEDRALQQGLRQHPELVPLQRISEHWRRLER